MSSELSTVGVETFTATIYVGLSEGRKEEIPLVHSLAEVESVCQSYVDAVGLCVTVTPTTFVYTNGKEPGAIVGLINYPRFPSNPEAIEDNAMSLAKRLLRAMGQYKVSVVFPDKTVMIGRDLS